MKTFRNGGMVLMLSLLFTMGSNTWAGETLQMQLAANNPCNPCGMKKRHNPCNPCARKMHRPSNPCGKKMHNPCNPCAGQAAMKIDPKLVKRPKGLKLYSGMSRKKLVAEGRKLFKDKNLSSNGISCNDCHSTNSLFNASFGKPYPHKISMAKQRAGVSGKLTADEFVQFCMLAPMAAKPLPWKSKKLAALTAYVVDTKQPQFVAWAKKNPCAMKNKMASANPCNPCGMKGHRNPCGKKMHNPCNPCAMKKHNPCNPCARKH